MLQKIKQARRMWNNGNTHGEIKEVTGLSHESESAATELAAELNLTPEQVFAKLPRIKEGMKSQEIIDILKS